MVIMEPEASNEPYVYEALSYEVHQDPVSLEVRYLASYFEYICPPPENWALSRTPLDGLGWLEARKPRLIPPYHMSRETKHIL